MGCYKPFGRATCLLKCNPQQERHSERKVRKVTELLPFLGEWNRVRGMRDAVNDMNGL